MNENVKKKGPNKIFGILLLLIAVIAIGAGIFLTYITSPKFIATETIKKMSENIVSFMDNNKTDTGLEENYKKTSTVTMNLQSDYLTTLSQTDPSVVPYVNLLRNLTNTTSTTTMVQDIENSRLFLDYNTTLNEEPLINLKYLVENSTEYYYIDGVSQTYINNGNNNYFESLNSETSINDNTKYLIEKVGESLASHIEDSYLSSSYESDYKKITITLTEDDLVTVVNNVLSDLKKDSKASKILSGYNENFNDFEINKDMISGLGTVEFNIYIDKVLGTVKKYDINLEESKIELSYDDSTDQKELELIANNESVGKVQFSTNDGNITLNIVDDSNNVVGTISTTKTSTNYDIIMNLTLDTTIIDINYNNQITNLKKNTSYDSTTNIAINISSNNTTLINGTINITSNITNDTRIEEDTSTSVLASTLPAPKEQLLTEKMTTVFTRLMI